MSTLNGFIRSAAAASRRMEKQRQYHAREQAKRLKEQLKLDELEYSENAVTDYNTYLQVLQSIHKDVSKTIDWQSIKNETPPNQPQRQNSHEMAAAHKLKNFKPSILDKLFNTVRKKISQLELALSQAKAQDERKHLQEIEAYKEEKADWDKLQFISDGVINKLPEAYKEAIVYFDPFSEISNLGSKVEVTMTSEKATINFQVNSPEIVPDFILSRTSTGKLSKKNMPVSRFNEIYQDYVCSALLRLAREIFAYLPIDYVVVNAEATLLNKAVGKMELNTILSAAIYPEKLKQINFLNIDPSDSMSNFSHNMKFSKTNGFSIVEKIDSKRTMDLRSS